MPPPNPDPVNEAVSSGLSGLGWPEFATITTALSLILAFLYKLLKGKAVDSDDSSKDQDKEIDEIKKKVRDLKDLANGLDDHYRELKKEIDQLEDTIEELDKRATKEIRRLEERLDKIIDLILKLLSEQS